MTEHFDLKSCFTHQIRLFKILGFWKLEENSRFQRVYSFYTFVYTLITSMFVMSQILYLHLNRTNVEEFIATFYVIVTFLVVLIKVIAIYTNIKEIKVILEKLQNSRVLNVKCEREEEIASAAKRLTSVNFFICLYFGVQTNLLWAMIPFWTENGRTTLARGWFPFDWKTSQNYVLTYIFQLIAITWNILACLNIDTTFPSFVIQIGLQCDLLCSTLNNLDQFYSKDGVLFERSSDQLITSIDRGYSEEMTNNLLVCIKHHETISWLVKEIENIFRVCLLFSFIGAAFILCFCLYQLSMFKLDSLEYGMLFFYLTSMLTEQIEYCWFGNEMKYKSANIIDAAFNTSWADCDLKYRKYLLQFMTNTRKPLIMRAGGLIDITIATFLSILRSSYSYFSVLKQMAE